ncbi:polysaccharide pyruvyl transferase family protein [Ruminococcus flavefaciens]|uniref:polysaccharide pyruvyl transferase family protein n=1 Tax=Ruminococcus flavefaciens TaxID=1265 RepID=UPI000467DE87|nr:polysaccharide pyruvyl transferase family protein [Ruminococcus flavefaciens]
MPKIGILTWLHNGNYGTVLQAYALQRFLRNMGYNVQNINFNASTKQKIKNLIVRKNSPKLFMEKMENYLTEKKADKEKLFQKKKRFSNFLNENFNLTAQIDSYIKLTEYSETFDIYICGSDQIWSPALLNTPYYFDFVSSKKRKIAYSCSFGVSRVPVNKKKIIAELLQDFDYISVRENSGKKIVKELIRKEVPVMVDPVFLLNTNEWDEIASERLVDGEYVFAYFLTYNKEYFDFAQQVSKMLGVKLVVVPVTKEEYQIQGDIIQDVGPAQWISLIKYSKMVLTDSFHGSVFSLLYQKKFLVFKRFNDKDKNSQNSRIYTLIKQYGLQKHLVDERLLSDFDFENLSTNKNDLIKKNSSVSKKWIVTCIQGECNE